VSESIDLLENDLAHKVDLQCIGFLSADRSDSMPDLFLVEKGGRQDNSYEVRVTRLPAGLHTKEEFFTSLRVS